MSKTKLSPLFQLRNLMIDEIYMMGKDFLGKTLTIIDASIADPEQRKGIKDLIKEAYYSGQSKWANKRIRTKILQFGEKFCPDLAPKTNSEESSFLGEDITDESCQPDYFEE